ncbi:MAG TPA: HD domain-containing protein [Candidatus Angelobacter sp.]|nr:HD domain-containing protein [Candidatus Angelobacter sp.]
MTGALHRVGQFWRHASARVRVEEAANADRILGPSLAPLFHSLPVNDQRHGLDVLATVTRVDDHPERLLLQAALLHDVGKGGARFSIIERSVTVFLHALSPRLLDAALGARPGLARRYRIYADHARIGAERVRAAGAGELAAIIAEHHATEPSLDITRRLQRADRRN